MSDGARAVGDGEGGGLESGLVCFSVAVLIACQECFLHASWRTHLSHGVGLAAVGDLSGLGAVGGIGSHDLSGVVGILSRHGGHKGSGGGDDGETHVDWLWY